MRLAKIAGFFLALTTASSYSSVQTVPTFTFLEKQGPYAVGVKVVEQYDYARVFRHLTDDLGKPVLGERARPLQTVIWYPANETNTTAMTVADYANLMATEVSFGKPDLGASSKRRIEGMTPALATPLWAARDAPLAPGRFPVVTASSEVRSRASLFPGTRVPAQTFLEYLEATAISNGQHFLAALLRSVGP